MNRFLDYVAQYVFSDIRVVYVLLVVSVVFFGYILFFYKEKKLEEDNE